MKITNKDAGILGIASLALLLMYVFPLWLIDLEAPQYPEGIGLEIMIDTVRGQKEHDLGNINNLNHYIGMKRIEPDAIPELKIMPPLMGFMIVFGLVAAWSRKRWMLMAWVGTFAVLSVVGLVDFWLWEYDYGHNLDVDRAIIKVPGMNYQPPLIGSKKLLNFTAHSWPGVGGWVAILSMLTGVLLLLKNLRRPGVSTASTGSHVSVAGIAATVTLAATLSVTLSGCSDGPRPIEYGKQAGEHCRMTISDERFATQIVTNTGRAYSFDAVECLLSFAMSGTVSSGDIASIWVTDASAPRTLIPAETATFVRSSDTPSPMGAGLIAFNSRIDAEEYALDHDGEVLNWRTLKDEFKVGFALDVHPDQSHAQPEARDINT